MLITSVRSKRPRRRVYAGNPRLVKALAMLLLPVLVAMVVACGDANSGNGQSSEPYASMPEGKPPLYASPVPDPIETLETKPLGQLPDFISTLDPKPRERTTAYYQGAVDYYDSYKFIPCYCGCAIYTTPHENLAQCFIKERTDGEVTFTDHSLTCSQCQSSAKLTIEGIAAGKPLKDIRNEVHESHKYTGIWTDTPPVP